MAQSTVHRLTSLVVILAVTSSAKDQGRWSRQISSYTSDISDWVPLSGPVEREPPLPPIKRQAVAEPRILTEPFPGLPRPSGFSSDTFPSRAYYNTPANRQLYLQSVPSVPSAPQNFLTDQGFGQGIRFGLSQPNFPLNHGFVYPQFGYESVPHSIPQIKQKPEVAPANPTKFEDIRKHTPLQVPMAIQLRPFNNQDQKVKPEAPKFIDGYRAENTSNTFTYSHKKKPQSLQKIKFDNYEKPVSKPEGPQNVPKIQHNNQNVEREEVQLLYVPLESLNRGNFNFRNPLTSSQLLNSELYSQGVPQLPHKKPSTDLYRPIQKTVDNPTHQNYFSEFNSQLHSLQQKDLDQVPKFSTLTSPFPTSPPTTPKPKKLKPHQPPLAIFLTEEANKNNQIKVGDVLASLKTANSVAVLDSVNPLNAPKVFIGPSSLQPPEHYVKFELPYLSNIENSDKKLRQLPFFVAPLSYNTPQGFAKIPFPSPHVGSVVINSQIRETSTQGPSTENLKPSYYTGTYRQEQKPATQKPSVSFYTTAAPKTSFPSNYQSNYYQFEPQTVSTLRPLKEPETVPPPRPGSYYLGNSPTHYNPQYNTQYKPPQYELTPQNIYQSQPEPVKTYTIPKVLQTTTTSRTTTSITTKLPSTFPSQLLETHNPYSINQAFQFSTPLDYRTYIDDYKEPIATPVAADPQKLVSTTIPTPKVEEVVTEQQRYQQPTSPHYQNYSPEIQYESEVQNSRYPAYNTNDYTAKTEAAESYSPVQTSNTEYNLPASNPTEYIENQQTLTSIQNETPDEEDSKLPTVTEVENPPTRYEYNQYENSFDSSEGETSSTTSTTTTSTRRPIRGRGRPRYTTTPRIDSSEYSTRAITRKPLRERRPISTRPRYEPNKITTEKPTRKPVDYSEESTTKAVRIRTRGRVTYKPSEDIYDRRKTFNSKEQDIAYQRDVLHQNYPVTIQERVSTVDIEAITEPTIKSASTKTIEPVTETYDTENAYTYERATISQQNANADSNENIPVFPIRTTVHQTDTSYVPILSTRNEEYLYHSRSSLAPVDAISYEETPTEKEDGNYPKQTTPVQKESESVAFATEATSSYNEPKDQSLLENNEYNYKEEEETTTAPEVEVTKGVSEETEEENVVQTTPSYNRVRVRPGVIKQYHQSSTESSRIKTDRQRPVTYRPAYDRRRTTMRIDEIQQDLKTKQVHGRQDVEDHRHPVYKPELSTEATSTQDMTTKRGQLRRRRPSYSYTTSTTEGLPNRKNTYEVKNRFRGRRPTTEKPTEKTEAPTETFTTTARPLYSRYSHRPRLSERYMKPEVEPEVEPEAEETEIEDQDSNFSINRPRYSEPDVKQWSPKIARDSFKPYNPNNIVDEAKAATTERRSDKIEMDIITARNEYEDVLISVTPATNNRNNKQIPEIPPTLEALVEQSKVTKSDAGDGISTFESMLEEVMKSLEEQDEDEYTNNVMKHKGGEIGEIPPERIISSEDSYNTKTTSPIVQEVTTTVPATADDSTTNEEETNRKTRRRGFWKKVKVRPVAAESIEVAESQYYPNTVNRLGQPLKSDKSIYDKSKYEKKVTVTTYKPTFQFIKDVFSSDDITTVEDVVPTVEIFKVNTKADDIKNEDEKLTTLVEKQTQTEKTEVSPADFDLGTGSPDPTLDDFYSTPTEATTTKAEKESFSFMDYLFGTTSEDDSKTYAKNETTTQVQIEFTTELAKPKLPTTESSFIPDELTESLDAVTDIVDDIKKVNVTTPKEEVTTTTTESPKIETSSQSSFMNPVNIVSTSMSTEISHETEICFRGKCIKTFRDLL